MKAVLLVLDSVGIGEAPDAAAYGDAGSATLPHLARAVGGLRLPVMQSLGLGNIPGLLAKGIPVAGVPPAEEPRAAYGAMREVSQGKDTVTGHWEMAGLEMNPGFALFPAGPPSFPPELMSAFEQQTGRTAIGNKAAGGLAIIAELGAEHMRSGAWIVYTSADSVFQIAAHTGVIPLEELYRGCEVARRLCDPYRVGRVIARPFTGRPGAFERTTERRDFAFRPSEPTILERLHDAGIRVCGVGKIVDIFSGRGISESIHSGSNAESETALMTFFGQAGDAFIFANFIDFDMLYGHRRDAAGYARALEEADAFIGRLLARMGPEDLLIVTADHGNDPTFAGTDHTREHVPLLVYRPGRAGRSLGVRQGFFDIARSLADFFQVPPLARGVSFLT